MRITLVSAFDPYPSTGTAKDASGQVGGVERVFGQVSQSLARRGHDVTLVCSTAGPGGTSMENGVQVKRESRRGTILRAPVARLGHHLTADADVVHVAATYPFTTPSVLRRAKELGTPSILDFHFEPDPGTTVGRLAASVYRRLTPPVYDLARSVLVRSMAYGRSAASLHSVPETRWRVVPNGVDPTRFHPRAVGSDREYILFVGRLVPYKGLDVLFHALSLPYFGVPLVVVGDGPLRKHLEVLARRLRIDVTWRGQVADEELPALYAGAALTVLPSVTRQECFGISLLESMACGTPVVASDLPGVADLACIGGVVAPPRNAAALAARIRHSLKSDKLPRGRELADRIHREFSWDAVTDRLEAVYQESVQEAPIPLAATR